MAPADHYKSSKAKAYLKEGRALRVETTINNATDFGVPKTLNTENWGALRKVGAATNARFLAALGEGQGGLPDPATLESVVLPTTHDGQRAPGLRFGEPRTMALLASVQFLFGLTFGLLYQATASVAPGLVAHPGVGPVPSRRISRTAGGTDCFLVHHPE